jgi:hypothetical protein
MLTWPVSIVLIGMPFSHLSHHDIAVKHPSRMGRLVLNLIASSEVTVSPSSPVAQSGNSTSLSDISGAFWLMYWVPVPSKFKISEMVCCDYSKSSIVISSKKLDLLI